MIQYLFWISTTYTYTDTRIYKFLILEGGREERRGEERKGGNEREGRRRRGRGGAGEEEGGGDHNSISIRSLLCYQHTVQQSF